ncbi:dynein heavy chain [Sugiyamaella lignohabitans]|uniref:Dynein heavy chain n=1 Tax=Sugiyamaella lignohabitans TaxID=796027 RepID=A0A161HMX8_9ASCO|nr:dynein heavy chain [Sugiyamaella lignohabitans]ANB15357.1 dynein heavy chain [Sugiyamaella lignohabitans]
MFRVFSKFNALFVRPAIRGAIQEYQTRLIENVKLDISSLQERFRQQYSSSEDFEMSKLRDMPLIAGTIGWIKQIESQLDMYMQRVEHVLGKGWQAYADGQKLYIESTMFRKMLDASALYQEWLKAVTKRNLVIQGPVLTIIQSRNRGSAVNYEAHVNFDPQIINLFKEVRNLLWMNFQIPHSLVATAKDAKKIYPFAVSLIDSLRVFSNIKNSVSLQYPELQPLLYGMENNIYKRVSQCMELKWDSLVHDYDINGESSRGEIGAAKLVYDIEELVTIYQIKGEGIVNLYDTILGALDGLRECEFGYSSFAKSLNTIQESVDKLSLEVYTNVAQFVSILNGKIKVILAERCEDLIAMWVTVFQDPQSKITGDNLFLKMKFATHELTLRNQVVHLSPPLKSTRVVWLAHLQDIISSICKLSKIEANRFDQLGKGKDKKSFSNIPLEISHSLLTAYKTIDNLLFHAENYLERWYQFQNLWDLEASRVFDILGDDMERWLQILSEIRKARTTFDTNEAYKEFGLLRIDIRPVQARIVSKYDAWQRDIIRQFAEILNSKMRDTCSEIEASRRDLEKQVIDISSTQAVVACIFAIQHSTKNLDRWEHSVSIFGRGEATLARYRFQFPSSWLYILHIVNEWNALNEILSRKKKALDQQQDAVHAKVQSEILRLNDRVNTLEEKWQIDKPVSGTLDPKETRKLLSKYESDVSDIQTESDLLAKASSALNIEFAVPSALEATVEEIRDFGSVWGALDTIWNSLNDLRETPWASVVPRKVRQEIDNLTHMTKNMPTRIRQYSAFQHIQNVLKTLSKANPLLSELRSDAIRERHWESLHKKLLQSSSRLFFTSMTLGNVWDMDLNTNASTVKDIIEIARGEMALEIYLREVREYWVGFSLELVNYKNTCRLIKNWDEIFVKSSDHINSLNTMHNSPYFKVFEEECRSWEEKLNRVHLLFDLWVDVQRQWVYLEGVFNNNMEIKHLLPVESSRFQNINSELFVILRKVYKSTLILDVLNISGIQPSIERLAELLEKVQKALGEYFEKERQRFSRFYFIGDEDLLEIIGNSTDIRRVEKHLSKMFSGIAGLLYEAETSLISGVISKEGEKLPFATPISLIKMPHVVDWLTAVETQTKTSLIALLHEAVDSLIGIATQFDADSQSMDESFFFWTQKFPTQINLLATQVVWTRRVEASLSSSTNPSLELTKSYCERMLEILAHKVLHDLTVIERKCCEALISELVHQRDIISHLIKENVTSLSDFEWQSQMTFHLSSNVKDLFKSLVVKQAKASFVYGFEYLGVPEKLVATPLLDKCFLSMTQALDQKLGGSPFGPAGTGMSSEYVCYAM